MKLQFQTRFGGLDTALDEQGNCFPTCLACILNLEVDAVPNFVGDNWYLACQEWLSRRGLFLITFPNDPYSDQLELQKYPVMIASGLGPRGHRHSVLWRNGRVFHDPHPSRDGLVGDPDEFELLVINDAELFMGSMEFTGYIKLRL